MKQLFALVSTTVLTFILCSTFARADTILVKPALMLTDNHVKYEYNQKNAGLFYRQNLPVLTSRIINLDSSHEFGFTQSTTIDDKNYFFEFTLIFNDKLQQLIAFFTKSDDNDDMNIEMDNDNFSTQISSKKCNS